jgi:small ligand-binding sensory domain FIST
MTNTNAKIKVATGSSFGAIAKDDHAKTAVEKALAKLSGQTIGSVLLFLSASYAQNPEGAIKEAAKAAGTMQITGCCALGLITEEDWVIDSEGAVAMAFVQEHSLSPLRLARQLNSEFPLALCLTSPNAAEIAISSAPEKQFGVLASDEFGHGPFSIWQSGKIAEQEFIHAAFPENSNAKTMIAGGLKALSSPLRIGSHQNHSFKSLDGKSALQSLQDFFPQLNSLDELPPYQIQVGITKSNSTTAIERGHYEVMHVASIDKAIGAVNLSDDIEPDSFLFWGIRDREFSEQTFLREAQIMNSAKTPTADFGLIFNNLSRGAGFYDGRDLDFEQIKTLFPGLPLIG